MRKAAGILFPAAAIGFGSLCAATPALADPFILIGPIGPVIAAGGFGIGAPAAAPNEGRSQGSADAAPSPGHPLDQPAGAYVAPTYDVVCAIETRSTPFGWPDRSACD
jgi:hypothetical protein